MSIQHTSRVIFKGVWRDLKTFTRYRAFLTGMLLEIVSLILGFAIIGGAYYFSPDVLALIGLSQDDLFLFMLTGSIIQIFSSIATWAPLNRIEEDIHYGTLEAVFVTPSSRMGYLLSTSIARGIISFLFFVPLYILTLWIAGVLTNLVVIGFTLLVAVIAMISNVAVGLYFGMLAIMFRQARLLISTTHQLIQFLFGAFLPVQGFMVLHEGFGTAMKYITLAFPFTYNFDLMRHFMFGEKYITLLPVWQEFVILGALTVIYLIVARFLLVPVERKAKKQGLSIL
ncbi:MAG: ABC transporter permease [Candidatus Heimdallarchaeota archaeon]|nr:MAG: ABC transporter permease [Candidatus Heimdallarchaeota archaeon]